MNTGGAVFQSKAWSLWPDGEGGKGGRRGEGQKRGGIS